MARTFVNKPEESAGTRAKNKPQRLTPEKAARPAFAPGHAGSVTGCLLGLAVADALSAPYAFLTAAEVAERYGAAALQTFAPWGHFPAGSFTKHTQLALATVRGCLRARNALARGEEAPVSGYVHDEYERWATAQRDPQHNRAPGMTCLEALEQGVRGSLEDPINASRENGAVLRMAPVGLLFDASRAFAYGVEFAAITHGHPSAYLPAGFAAELIAHLREGRSLLKAIERTLVTLRQYEGHEATLERVQFARELAVGRVSPARALSAIGQGWPGDEALAMGVYCALRALEGLQKTGDSVFVRGVRMALEADGAGEHAAVVAGALLGTAAGEASIPQVWRRGVEGAGSIRKLALRAQLRI